MTVEELGKRVAELERKQELLKEETKWLLEHAGFEDYSIYEALNRGKALYTHWEEKQ